MIRILSALSLAAAAVALSCPANASELRHVGGTCYADGSAACRPLRTANRVHVTYGPAVPLYPKVDPAYMVDQGPHPVAPSVPYDVGAYDGGYVVPGYPTYFQYGGGRRAFYHHHMRPQPHPHAAMRVRVARPAPAMRAHAPRAFMGARAPMRGGRHR
jgi:hypothetical protein